MDTQKEPRIRKKDSHWIFFASNYHKFGYNANETIDLCGKFDHGSTKVTAETLFEIQTKLMNHPTVIMYM